MNIHLLFKKFKNNYRYIFFIVLLLSLSACLKDNDAQHGSIPGTLVSIVHASPDAGPLVMGINGSRIDNQSFNFGNRIIYQLLYPGSYQFQTNRAADNKALDIKHWSLQAGMCYTIFATDRVDSLELLGVRDFEYGDQPLENHSKVRFINLCPDSLSLDLEASSIDTLLANNKKFKENTPFGDIPAIDSSAVYRLNILNHESNTSLTSLEFRPKEGKYYTIMASGFMETEDDAQKFKAFILEHD
ncbi:DUF4397 domain-containing protein [Olivibacter sp. SDN3]|uniref:DUF4397 domain-containing protein n=1 Tax=Olivibacter sp. SDN3 TaxID=2764720 RepID=UPI0016513884|nr:DUF4397 domain-containing protein [Olivibacter sp. SDN3]QNL48335.1 DUF4397 domain-containing protein [Olivibacter sp. SDN3]